MLNAYLLLLLSFLCQCFADSDHWVDLWTAAPSYSGNSISAPYNSSLGILFNTTLRQTVRVTLDAPQIRLRVSNAFGNQRLNITHMTVAYPGDSLNPNGNGTSVGSGSPAIQTKSLQSVTFSGNSSISLPNGALGVTDPIALSVKAQSQLSISIYLDEGQQGTNITAHLLSQTDSWFGHGDQTGSPNISGADVTKVNQWYFISAVEGWCGSQASSFAILGDSITDGIGTDVDGNNRWSDQLLERMQSEGDDVAKNVAVANQGYSGNRVLVDGSAPSALARIDKDILAQSGVAYAMIFDAVNDIGRAPNTQEAQDALYEGTIQAYQQIITRVHTAGIPMFGATITPFKGFKGYDGKFQLQTRDRLNDWISHSGKFDYVVDFAAAVANSTDPEQGNSTLGHGDNLHFNPLGYAKMAEAFDLSVFSKFQGGVSGYQ